MDIDLDQLEPATVEAVKGDDTFFAIVGEGMNTPNLKFYASRTENGAKIPKISIGVDPSTKPATNKIHVFCNADQVDDDYADEPLWVVGLLADRIVGSTQTLIIKIVLPKDHERKA